MCKKQYFLLSLSAKKKSYLCSLQCSVESQFTPLLSLFFSWIPNPYLLYCCRHLWSQISSNCRRRWHAASQVAGMMRRCSSWTVKFVITNLIFMVSPMRIEAEVGSYRIGGIVVLCGRSAATASPPLPPLSNELRRQRHRALWYGGSCALGWGSPSCTPSAPAPVKVERRDAGNFFCLEQWPRHSGGGGSRCPPCRPPPSAPVGVGGRGRRSVNKFCKLTLIWIATFFQKK
jgi:hypothetical protein